METSRIACGTYWKVLFFPPRQFHKFLRVQQPWESYSEPSPISLPSGNCDLLSLGEQCLLPAEVCGLLVGLSGSQCSMDRQTARRLVDTCFQPLSSAALEVLLKYTQRFWF